MTKLFFKRFSITILSELNLDTKSLVKLEESRYYLSQILLYINDHLSFLQILIYLIFQILELKYISFFFQKKKSLFEFDAVPDADFLL